MNINTESNNYSTGYVLQWNIIPNPYKESQQNHQNPN